MSAHSSAERSRPGPRLESEAGHDPAPTSNSLRIFRLSDVDLDSGCREIRVEGELDLAVADQLQRRLDVAAADDVDVLLNLARCTFVDSSGIAVIVLAHRLLAGQGQRLLVCHPSAQVGRVMAVTGLTSRGLVYPSVQAAALAERLGVGAPAPWASAGS